MNDKELVDRIVALGCAKYDDHLGYWFVVEDEYFEEYDVVRYWQVAGALMEKVNRNEWLININHDDTVVIFTDHGGENDFWGQDESLPRAICEACVEALT